MNNINIRNFAIIAHVDHGKSTLADRLLEITGTISKEKMQNQFLDQNPISRERGITIKLAPVRMEYKLPPSLAETLHFACPPSAVASGDCRQDLCILNLIDTPGHVDFSYEVNRSLAACEGAVLLVDISSGIQAQTVANFYQAKKQGLKIIPVINKIDLPGGDKEKAIREIIDNFEFNKEDIIEISAKQGWNIDKLLLEIINKIPPPKGSIDMPLKALVFDSQYDSHKGTIAYVKVVDGVLKKGTIKFLKSNTVGKTEEIGFLTPYRCPKDSLSAGEVGYIATGIKDISLVQVGDTITDIETVGKISPLPGYREAKPMVFIGLYPKNNDEFFLLKEALSKLKLNDAALTLNEEFSPSLGHGIRVGFLGILHGEIIIERLQREYNLELIATTPTVEYQLTNKGKIQKIQNVSLFIPPVDKIEEPWCKVEIITPQKHLGNIMKLCEEKRGLFKDMEYLNKNIKTIEEEREIVLKYDMPLQEVISDFYGLLKSLSEGFASLDWQLDDYRIFSGARLDILVNHEKIDAFSQIVLEKNAPYIGRRIVEKLKKVIPRMQFEIPLQACIGDKIIARETVPQYRKDVTGKLYGGDRTRKDKLLEAQKKGKKRLKQFGKVQIPQEAFLSLAKND